jgi:hypothetical protein
MREKCPLLLTKWYKSMNESNNNNDDDDDDDDKESIQVQSLLLLKKLKLHYPMLNSKNMSTTSKLLKSFDHYKTHHAHQLPTAFKVNTANTDTITTDTNNNYTDESNTLKTLKIWARDVFWRLYQKQHSIQTTLLCKNILLSMNNMITSLSSSPPSLSPSNTATTVVPKMCIYSGHDTTIMPMLATLQIVVPTPKEEWPPYGAHIRLELLQNENASGEYYVRMIYQNSVIMKSMNEFRALIQSQSKDMLIECQPTNDDDDSTVNPFQDNR